MTWRIKLSWWWTTFWVMWECRYQEYTVKSCWPGVMNPNEALDLAKSILSRGPDDGPIGTESEEDADA